MVDIVTMIFAAGIVAGGFVAVYIMAWLVRWAVGKQEEGEGNDASGTDDE
jgi:hypothetical protein